MASADPIIVVDGLEASLELDKLGIPRWVPAAVARCAAAARAEALVIDPVGSGGQLSYQYGVRSLREQLLPAGWEMSRVDNIEATVNFKLGIQLVFQNVDRACDPKHAPRAISKKGSASRSLVAAGQGELFAPVVKDQVNMFGSVPTVWVICVSSDENSLRCEVSCPESFGGEQFEGFAKRIFALDEPWEPNPVVQDIDTDPFDDIEVHVTRKQR